MRRCDPSYLYVAKSLTGDAHIKGQLISALPEEQSNIYIKHESPRHLCLHTNCKMPTHDPVTSQRRVRIKCAVAGVQGIIARFQSERDGKRKTCVGVRFFLYLFCLMGEGISL